ncbi:MAG TPA: Hg(II)-responsive transcriptional regulator [Burkholderiaceae bacterium]
MHEGPHSFTIGALATAAAVSVETIRYYQRKSLLPEPQRPHGSVRRYGPADVARVRFIKSAQRTGFSLDEIAQLLQLEDGAQCAQARTIAAHRLLDVRHRMADLQRIEAALAELVDRCADRRGRVACPLIASLQEAP